MVHSIHTSRLYTRLQSLFLGGSIRVCVSSVTHASVTAFCYITSVDRFHDTREADRGTTHESRGLDRSLERSRQKGAPRAA